MSKTTTVNAIPYPEDSDAPDGPAQIKALAELLDTLKWGSRNLKPTSGVKAMSGESGVELPESMGDIAGTELKITPAVASKLIVHAVFDFALLAGGNNAHGTIGVDASDQAAHAIYGPNDTSRATVTQVYEVALTAAEHTIKQRAEQNGGSPFNLLWPQGTRYHYWLIAS